MASGATPEAGGPAPARQGTTIIAILRRRWRFASPILLLAVVLAVVLESWSSTEYTATGTVLLVASEIDLPTTPTAVTTATIVRRLEDGPVAGGREDDDETFVGATRVDADNLQLFAAAETEIAATRALDDALEWLVDDVDAAYDEAAIPTNERSRVVIQPLDPAVWRLGDGWHASGATVQLENPGSGAANPYEPTTSMLRLLEIATTSDSGRATLEEEMGDDAVFEIHHDRRDAAPVAQITTRSPDADGALAAFDAVAAFLSDELDARQRRAGVAADRRHGLEVIGRPVAAERTDRVPSGPTVLVLLLGAAAALGGAALVDWRRLRAQDASSPAHDGRMTPVTVGTAGARRREGDG